MGGHVRAMPEQGHSAGAQVVGAGCDPWCGVTSILAGMSTAGNSQTAKSVGIVTEERNVMSVFVIR